MIRLVFFALLFSIFDFACFSQDSADTPQKTNADQYRQDFEVLRKTFEQNYPSLYRFHDKKTIDKMFDSCYASIGQQTNSTNFYATVKYVLSALEDGHLSSAASPGLRDFFESQSYFPLSLVFLQNGVYNYCSDSLIPGGAEIVSINGAPMQTIRERLYAYLTSDGKIKTSKSWTLNSVFWFYYYLVYGAQQTFAVQYKLSDGTNKTASINAWPRKNFICSDYQFRQDADLLDLSYPVKNVAVLTIKTFSHEVLTEARKDFGTFLDSAFKAIKQKNIDRLIIDLRGNGGGADVYGARLYSYLSSKPFRYYKELETKERKLTIADHPNLDLQKPADIHYDGEVSFLINGLSFSATAEFCSIAKTNNRGKFVGEETGGGYYGNTSGGFVKVTLPNTAITVSISTTKYVMAVRDEDEKDRGIIPDYNINPTITDVLQNRDVQMEQAIKIATTGK